ncbi:MAG: hypothetical protein H6821_13670 [Planctomycetaceae bacterium]|nr:hypothetical protein [Planctomycetales bacterium]MCB9875217.1 hypothetical protein [Planctomycetaceae bacterium]MCB9938888.1 hypothetical protein [Planctomycetaceae bacterium]HRX78390.1 hypothetical protein [Pirellulaceae bacterium]
MQAKLWLSCTVLVAMVAVSTVNAADWGLKKGNADLKSAGPLAFGPDGILLVGDVKAATVFAIDTGDASGDPGKVSFNIKSLNEKVADAAGASSANVTINDVVVNPASGNVYISASADGKAAIVRIDASGVLSQVKLEGVGVAKVALPNAPEDKVVGEGRRRGNARDESITDLAYSDGKVLVSGVSPNPDGGRPLSTVRELAFPLTSADAGVNVEIYHGAHGGLENFSTVRTFVPFNIDGKPSVLAGFTCTPLVRFDVKSLKSDKPVRGTTVAELGNRNRPYDMIVYEKGGESWLLMANSARGVMKISTKDIGRSEGITAPVGGGGVAGQTYETVTELEGVVQLDRLNDTHAIIVVQNEGGSQDLATIELP